MLKSNRLGLVVSKKVGKAVRRNRIKRMIREAFRLNQASLFSGADIVAIPRFGAYNQPLMRYVQAFQNLSRKITKQKKDRKPCPESNF